MTDYARDQFLGMFREAMEISKHIADMVDDIEDSLDKIACARERIKHENARLDYLRCVFEREYDLAVCDFMDDDERGCEEQEKPCFVYYILNEEKDKVKIGVSNDPIKRAKALQTASGEEIEILHTIEFKNRNEAMTAESFLHNIFGRWRKRPSKVSKSCEWFDVEISKSLMLDFDSRESILGNMESRKIKMRYTGRCEQKGDKQAEGVQKNQSVIKIYKSLSEIAEKNPIPKGRLLYGVDEVEELLGISHGQVKALAKKSGSLLFIPPKKFLIDLKELYGYIDAKSTIS